MTKFTQDELILFLYQESSPELTAAIEAALETDWELQDRLKVLKRTIKQLDQLKLKSPRTKSVNALIDYAKYTLASTSTTV